VWTVPRPQPARVGAESRDDEPDFVPMLQHIQSLQILALADPRTAQAILLLTEQAARDVIVRQRRDERVGP